MSRSHPGISRIATSVFALAALLLAALPSSGLANGAAPTGTVLSWGVDPTGQLGYDVSTTCTDPYSSGPYPCGLTAAAVPDLGPVVQVAAGNGFSLALKSDGTVWAWGRNDGGQLGDGTNCTPINYCGRSAPMQVHNLAHVTTISAGVESSMAVEQDGTVWGWGWHWANSPTAIPAQVNGLSGVVAVAEGDVHHLALKSDGTLWAWGDNQVGELGDGTITYRPSPVQVIGLSQVVGMVSSAFFSLALEQDGTVWAWGWNNNGQLGTGTTMQCRLPSTDVCNPTPEQVPGLNGISAVSAGFSHSLALKNNGTVWIWGTTDLGNGAASSRSDSPVQVQGLNDVTAISGDIVSSLVLRSNRTAWGWGLNEGAVLGDGSNVERLTPVQTQGATAVVALSAGAGHALALQLPYIRTEDGTTAAIAYAGPWKVFVNSHLSGGTAHYASSPTATVTFSFTGTDLQVLLASGPQAGKATVTLDGVATTVDTYNATARAGQPLYSKTGLALGSHTVVIRPSGQKNPKSSGTTIALDAIDSR
jgi:alpha-tubulin suppressor-like RCC1 family protein